MTIPRIIGKLICSLRARFGARKVHAYRRPRKNEIFDLRDLRMRGITDNFKVCDRCGHTVPVKPRKRKGAENAATVSVEFVSK